MCDVIRIGRVLGTRWCASSRRALQAIWQNYPAVAKQFADNITRPPFGGLHKILTSSTFLKNLALMLDAFGEVSELSIALQSESTTLSKAYELVKRCIIALAQDIAHTNIAEESCIAGVRGDVVLTSYSKVKIVNLDRLYQSSG